MDELRSVFVSDLVQFRSGFGAGVSAQHPRLATLRSELGGANLFKIHVVFFSKYASILVHLCFELGTNLVHLRFGFWAAASA